MSRNHLANVKRLCLACLLCVATNSALVGQGSKGYQRIAPPPRNLPAFPAISNLPPSNSSFNSNLPGNGNAANWNPPASGSLELQPTDTGTYFEGPNHDDASFNAFSLSVDEKMELRPWQTFDIPIGSFGATSTWDPDHLNATTIERFRKAFVQKVELKGGYVRRGDEEDLGYSFASAAATMVVPLGSTDNLLVFTPRYGNTWIDGPSTIDVPARLQSAAMDIGWRKVINSQWSTIIGLRPGYFNDFDSQADGFRLGGLAVVNYKMIPDILTVTLGVVYFDRNDTNLLPAVGVTWIPDPDTRFELNFPKPKIAKRVSHLPFTLEDWIYVSATLGGGTWAVQRSSGVDDELTLKDIRVAVGYERILNGGTGYFVDVGYVFDRDMEYELSGERLDFGDSFIVEAGLSF